MTPQEASIISAFLLPQVEFEIQTTARVLAAVPEDQKGYTPSPKCMTAETLAKHIVGAEIWFLEGILKGEFGPQADPQSATIAELAVEYTTRTSELLEKVKAIPAEDLARDVKFFAWDMPNVTYLQIMQKHSAHHRGQLSAYLRPMGSKVPAIYGGSADEPISKPATEGN